MNEIAVTFAVLGAAIVLFVWNRLPVEVVAVGVALALWATGVLRLDQALAGFADPTVLFIATLFVASEALTATGVTAWVSQQLLARAGASRTRLLVMIMLAVAPLTALVNPNGSVAALLPVVVLLAVRLGLPPSKLLLPLAFFSYAGSLLALTGTPVSVIVSDAAAEAGGRPFGFFEFALVGVPLVLGSLAIVVPFGDRLLPERRSRHLPPDFSQHVGVLTQQYRLGQRTYRLQVDPRSPYVGRTQADLDLGDDPQLALVGVQVRGEGPLAKDAALAAGDVLVVQGERAAIDRLAAAGSLDVLDRPRGAGAAGGDAVYSRYAGVAEVVIPPRSGLIGTAMFPGMVTESGELVVLAIQRGGEDQGPKETELQAGDTLLVRGTWAALEEHLADPDVLVVDAPESVRRQVVPMGRGSRMTLAVLLGLVVLLTTGVVPPVVAGLLTAGVLLVLGVLTMQQAYRGMVWTTLVLLAGMIPLSVAMQETGAAALMAETLVGAVGGAGPYALLVGLFLLTASLGQLISNTATALIVIPVAVAAAGQLGVSALPVLMSVNVAAAASFLTPIATTPNLFVLEPGAYRFGDYWRLGLPLMLLYFAVAILLVPVFWAF
jgi:di/tricarboxylate transporter